MFHALCSRTTLITHSRKFKSLSCSGCIRPSSGKESDKEQVKVMHMKESLIFKCTHVHEGSTKILANFVMEFEMDANLGWSLCVEFKINKRA